MLQISIYFFAQQMVDCVA